MVVGSPDAMDGAAVLMQFASTAFNTATDVCVAHRDTIKLLMLSQGRQEEPQPSSGLRRIRGAYTPSAGQTPQGQMSYFPTVHVSNPAAYAPAPPQGAHCHHTEELRHVSTGIPPSARSLAHARQTSSMPMPLSVTGVRATTQSEYDKLLSAATRARFAPVAELPTETPSKMRTSPDVTGQSACVHWSL